MNYRKFPVMLLAAGIFAAAQSIPAPPSRPSPQEALRLIAEGQFAKVRQFLPSLIEDAKRTGAPPAYEAGLWRLLGGVERSLGRYEEAKSAVNHGLQLCEDKQLAEPELTIALLVILAQVHRDQGHLDEANRVVHRAMGVASEALPPGHPLMAWVQVELGGLCWTQGKLSAAEKAFRMALAILEGRLGHDHLDVAIVAIDLAGLLTMTGRQPEAVPLIERSKTVFERAYGPAHPDTIGATFALGAALLQSAPDKADLLLRQAVVNWRASQPERHPHMIKFLGALALSRYTQGDYREAGLLSEQALQISKDLFGPEHAHTIGQMYQHAQLLKNTRRRKEAAALKREADRLWKLQGYADPDRQHIDILALRSAMP